MASKLTAEGRADLAKLEKVVREGLTSFVAVGNAITEIRERRLYLEYASTFEAYIQIRFGMSRQHAYRQIAAAETVALLSPVGDTQVLTESAIRPLTELPKDQQAEAFKEAKKAAEDAGEKLSSKHTGEAAKGREKRNPPTPAQRARAAQKRTAKASEAETKAPEPDRGSTDERPPSATVAVPSEVGAPTGAPAPEGPPAWILAALAIVALPLSNEQAQALTAAEADRLFVIGTACTNVARRAKLLRKSSEAA